MTKKLRVPLLSICMLFAAAGGVFAGPVILGGDDLTDHGSRSGGVNIEGWLYIEKAVSGILTQVTRSGPFTVSIAALGSADPGAGVYTTNDAGGAINSVADALGVSVQFVSLSTGINAFFSDLSAGTVNPSMLWLAGTDANNDITFSEGVALTSNAAAINSFVASGGGLMAHGSGVNAYGWLSALLPGLSNVSGCIATGATLTAAGTTAFPGLSNSDIDSNAGPCHSHFEGDLGGLTVLAIDGADPARNYIIGGGAGTAIRTVIPEPGTFVLIGFGLAVFARAGRRKKISNVLA